MAFFKSKGTCTMSWVHVIADNKEAFDSSPKLDAVEDEHVGFIRHPHTHYLGKIKF